MADIGIIGGGVAGLQLGLGLRQRGIATTIYAERTSAEQLVCRLSNMVARNACTRARERQLGVNHWDDPHYDMHRLAVSIHGQRPMAFSGRMGVPAHSVDLRIYWARLLDDFSQRGGRVVVRTVRSEELDGLASRHDLLVVASGRTSLSTIFPRVAKHSPFTSPQRLIVGGLFRGVAFSEPRALEMNVTPGSGEILSVPMQSFEAGLTGIGILITAGGAFEPLRQLRYEASPKAFVDELRRLLRVYAPAVHERIDSRTFDLSRPQDLGYAAITPTVRQGFIELASGRHAVALGDAHVLIDPITGQGSNNASHAAAVLCQAIQHADAFDQAFCRRVEQDISSHVIPVSDASNARLVPPTPHFRELMTAAARHQAVADVYADGFHHPERFWEIGASAERTAQFLSQFEGQSSTVA